MIPHRRIVVCDLDSTIANTYQRRRFAPKHGDSATDADWYEYAMACADDELFAGVQRTLALLEDSLEVHICSGRSAEALELTQTWLALHKVRYDHLRLRRRGEVSDNALFKVEYIRQLQLAGHEVVLMIEDWPRVAKMVTEMTGVPTLLVNPDYPDGDAAMKVHEATSVDNPSPGR